MTTHYDNLQISQTASDQVVRAAYKTLAQKYHPDRFTGSSTEAERIMKILNEAYSVLSDPTQRRAHDKWISSLHSIPKVEPALTSQKSADETSQLFYEVKPAKFVVTCGAMFGLYCLVAGFQGWLTPDAGSKLYGPAFGVPIEYVAFFFKFAGLPFGLLLLSMFGTILLNGNFMILDNQGMRYTALGGRLYRWDEIHNCEGKDGKLLLSGISKGKPWKMALSFKFFSEAPDKLIEKFVYFKNISPR